MHSHQSQKLQMRRGQKLVIIIHYCGFRGGAKGLVQPVLRLISNNPLSGHLCGFLYGVLDELKLQGTVIIQKEGFPCHSPTKLYQVVQVLLLFADHIAWFDNCVSIYGAHTFR